MYRSLLGFLFAACAIALHAQGAPRSVDERPVVVLTASPDLRSSVDRLPELRSRGMTVAVIVGPGCFFGRAPGLILPALRELPGVVAVIDVPVGGKVRKALTEAQRTGVDYLNDLLAGTFERTDVLAPMDWSAHPQDHALEPPVLECARVHTGHGGGRSWLPQTLDWTCGNAYNSEVLDGVVVASTFFIESNGAVDPDLYTWTQADINSVKAQVIDAWSIWSYTASLFGRTVTAVMDWYEPSGGVPVQAYEPVTRPSTSDNLWIDAILGNTGRTEAGAFGKLYAFNHDRRSQLGADRSLCAFVAYNPGAAPSQFTDGKIGYAYLGGPYMQILWRANGWSSTQINRVYGHETGHIFHAFDEYTASGSTNCGRSFNGRPNSNYQGSTCNGTAGCVMISNAFSGSGATRSWNLCAHTPYHLGWQGLLNVPMALAPLNDSVLTAVPFTLRFDRAGAPASAFGYVKVHERTTDTLVYCGYVGQADTLAITLVNGLYRWVVTQGNTSTGSGFAGRISSAALFTVNAPLNAAFSRNLGTICAGSTVQFQNMSTGAPSSWTWGFPGGTPTAWTGAFPPPVRYDLPGTYSVTLTVGDGLGTDTEMMASAVTVTGGAALPFAEGFNGPAFPPSGWTASAGGGVGQGGGGLTWAMVQESSCAQAGAAGVPAWSYAGGYAFPTLKTPRIDLTQASVPYVRFKYSYARRSTTPGGTLTLTANNCNFTRFAELFNRNDTALATNGGAVQASPAWSPVSCSEWREAVLRLDSVKGHVAELTFRFGVFAPDQDVHVDDVSVFDGVRLKVKVLLEGPLDTQTGLMADQLRAGGFVPLSEPYSALGFTWTGEAGARTTTAAVLAVSGTDAVVDWVVVELRDAVDPTRVVASAAALLQRDGDVVDTDGLSGVRFPALAGSYHVAVRHRNHLPVCTAAPVAVSSAMPTLDLTLPTTTTWGNDARKSVGPYMALWSGDHFRDQSLRYTGPNNDRDPILLRIGGTAPTATASGYLPEDCTMDGVVKYTGSGNDRDKVLLNIGGTVPTAVRAGQLP